MEKDSVALQALIAPAISALGYELLGCMYFLQGHEALLRVYIDSEQGITVDDCQQASRQISAVLDVEDPITGEYTLEVSSPGLDRPLFTREHYQRFIGRSVRIHLRAPHNGRRNFKGIMTAVVDDTVVVCVDEKEFTLSILDVEKANLVPEF